MLHSFLVRPRRLAASEIAGYGVTRGDNESHGQDRNSQQQNDVLCVPAGVSVHGKVLCW